MNIVLDVLVVAETVITVGLVLAVFVWAAVKDGQANDAIQAQILRRHWPRHTA